MKLNIGEIRSQIDQMNANMTLKSAQAEELLNAINVLINDDELEGKAFEAAKNYFEQLHLPILRGLILAYDEIKNANTSYLNDLYNQVEADDGFYMDTEAVSAAISEKQVVISELEEKVSALSTTMPSFAVSTQNYINLQQQAVATLQAEQQKVFDFESIHGSHYNLANLYLENVSSGISSIQGKHFDKDYMVHKIDVKNLSWANALNNGWKLKKAKKNKTDKVDYKKLNSDFWKRTDSYFEGNWWQDPEKLQEVTAVLKSEAEANGGINLEDLISQYSAEEVNLRLYALQTLANALRTGNYDEDILNAITVNLYAEGEEFDASSKIITVDDLDMLQSREKNLKGRKAGDWLEGGGLQLLLGVAILAVASYAQNKATVEQQVDKVKQIVKDKTTYESYKKWLQDETGGVKIPKGNVGGVKNRLPKTNGKWKGEPGNGEWHSNNPDVLEVTKGKGVPFENGRPNFSNWKKGTLKFKSGVLDGSKNDFSAAYDKIKQTKGFSSRNQAKNWLREKGITPHHKSATEIELIPSKLHKNIPHIGSAADLRGAN